MNQIENIIGICKNQIWLSNKEYLIIDHRYEGTYMVYQCKIYVAVT